MPPFHPPRPLQMAPWTKSQLLGYYPLLLLLLLLLLLDPLIPDLPLQRQSVSSSATERKRKWVAAGRNCASRCRC